jgi:putative transposase
VTRCWFVDDHRADYPVVRLCRLVELPRATYYRWANPTLSDQFLDDAYLANDSFDIHQMSRRTYGSPRVWGQLRRKDVRVGVNRVARLMAVLGLAGAHSRKKWRRGAATAPGEDLIGRDFTAEKSDSRWLADITEFKCIDGKLFLSGILDLHDRGLAGWSMGQRQTSDLVVNAVVMALTRRDPDNDIVHHADRGTQAGLNRWSQHRLVGESVGVRRRLRRECASQALCGAVR